jgi:hypothetical protein
MPLAGLYGIRFLEISNFIEWPGFGACPEHDI